MSTDPLLTTAQVAAYLQVPETTVRRWRLHGVGPAGFRVGKHVRYRQSTVDEWLAERERNERES